MALPCPHRRAIHREILDPQKNDRPLHRNSDRALSANFPCDRNVMAYINNASLCINNVTRSIPSVSAYISNASPYVSNVTTYIANAVANTKAAMQSEGRSPSQPKNKPTAELDCGNPELWAD